jgi:hypothetical protein
MVRSSLLPSPSSLLQCIRFGAIPKGLRWLQLPWPTQHTTWTSWQKSCTHSPCSSPVGASVGETTHFENKAVKSKAALRCMTFCGASYGFFFCSACSRCGLTLLLLPFPAMLPLCFCLLLPIIQANIVTCPSVPKPIFPLSLYVSTPSVALLLTSIHSTGISCTMGKSYLSELRHLQIMSGLPDQHSHGSIMW